MKLLSWKLSHNPENATHVGQHNARRVEQGIGLGEFLTRLECLHWWRSIVGAKSKSRAIEPALSLNGFRKTRSGHSSISEELLAYS